MQGDKAIAYTSRALTQTEINYAQIEKELLAVVVGIEIFEQYTYGQKVVMRSNNKPLENIVRKNLMNAQKRLLRLRKYDYEIVYRKGKKCSS